MSEKVVSIKYSIVEDDDCIFYQVTFVGENGFTCDYLTDDEAKAKEVYNEPPRMIP